MDAQTEPLQELRHIKKMMERSIKFSSISGFSAIAAGICGLLGIWLAVQRIAEWRHPISEKFTLSQEALFAKLLVIALSTFAAASISSFIFIYLRCKKLGISVLGKSAQRVMINMAIPLFIGGLFSIRLATGGAYELIAPACLLFYGLALINASKYTLTEIRILGFVELGLGIVNLWIPGYGLILWAIGFAVSHIIFGIIIWWKYERNFPRQHQAE